MSIKARSVVDTGFNGVLIDIECHMSNGLPGIIIVGFANKAVDEAKERIRSAFTNAGLNLPKKRITINLAPADLPKESTAFDLAIASVIMRAGSLVESLPSNTLIIGELGLDGSVRAVRGIIGKILAAKNLGITTFIIPYDNLAQAKLIPEISLIPVKNLHDMYLHLTKTVLIQPVLPTNASEYPSPYLSHSVDFQEVIGQEPAKRALEIAAAGGHNILLNGPPGTGKSMLAKALVTILPPMSSKEILEVTHLHSLQSNAFETIITTRPFRAPHHSASDTAIIGGGKSPKPGEISLSHGGVLFFDELPEFHRVTLEALRQPLEDKVITVSRAKDSVTFPANFMFVATSNPCPCGYYGSEQVCSCMPYQIVKYQRKLSGPILDRIDIYSTVDHTPHAKLLDNSEKSRRTSSQEITKRVRNARNIQHKRFGEAHRTNSTMTNKEMKRFIRLTPEAKQILDTAGAKMNLSARGYMRTVRVAQTIADLANNEQIDSTHVAEALQYRPKQVNPL